MGNVSVEARFIKIVTDVLGRKDDQVGLEFRLIDDLGADSLDLSEILEKTERKFRIKILEDEEDGILTVGDAIDLIEEKVKCKALQEAQLNQSKEVRYGRVWRANYKRCD